MQAEIQHTGTYEEYKLFLSHSYTSKEVFSKEYRRIYQGKPKAEELNSVVAAELKNAVLDGNVANFKHFCKLIDYIRDIESPTPLKTNYTDTDSHIKAINLVILACKHDRIEILKYIFNDARVFENVSVFAGKDAIVPDDKDETSRNAFYYAIRSSNVEILDLFISNWPGNYFASRSLLLDEILSRAYEHLKLQNVWLSNEMEIFVESKLINLRFFSNSSSQGQSAKDSLCSISERINFVLKSIALLKSEYSNDEKVDTKFLFVCRFIAQNIQVLKRRLKLTYDRLPWEEMEFCLVAFVSSYLKQQEINLFYRAILNKSKILLYLENFAKTLSDVKPFVESLDASKLAELPKLNREQVVKMIIHNDPQFSELYNDYQQIRDIHSLERVSDYLNLALSTDPKEHEGQIIITRALQVIGEYFKNTLESPKLSSTTSELLLFSLPKNTRKVIIDLRNSLSHAYSLSKRTEIYANSDVNFFIGVQNDTKRIDNVIIDILYKNKIKMVEILLKKIISSETVDELKAIGDVLSSVKLEKVISHDFNMMELEKIEKLIQQLSNAITNKTSYEKELFNRIKGIISSTKTKSKSFRADFSATLAILTSLNVALSNINFDHNSMRGIKFCANKALKNFIPRVESENLKEIVEFSMIISRNAKSRITGDNLDTITELAYKIFFIAEFEINDIKWVEKLRRGLQEKCFPTFVPSQTKTHCMSRTNYDKQLTDKLSELQNILSKDLSSGKLIDYKENKKLQAVVEMLVLDIMSILGRSEKHLENNLLFLDDNSPLLTGKSLRNHLAHGNILLDVLSSDPSLAIVLNAEKLVSENIVKSKKKVGKLVKDDPSKLDHKFDQDLIIIANQENMFDALVKGNLEELESYLEKGADIKGKSINSSTALHFAAQGSNLELVKFIVDQNVSINVKNMNGQTPLHIAAAHGRKNIMEFLLEQANVLVNDSDAIGKTPLHLSAKNGHKDAVEILLKNGANTNAKDNSGYSPLHYGVRNNHIRVVQVLLKEELNVDINEVIGGSTSLHTAAEFGCLEVVEFLVENGANVGAKNDKNGTPLHSAALNGHLEVVNFLILKGADINAKVLDGCTPLHYAVENRHENVAKALLEQGADVNAADKAYSFTPLHYAAGEGHEKIVQILLEKKVNVNITNRAGSTPLHLAAQGGHFRILASLLKHGANIHAKDLRNYTALHYAAENGFEEIAQLLVRRGAEVDVKGLDNLTPLNLAATKGYEHTVAFLIKNGAKICYSDAMGYTCFFVAASNGHKGVIKILLKNKAQVDCRSFDGRTPLHGATLGGHYDITVLLLDHKADVNAKDNFGHTPLYMAIFNGHQDIVALLIKNGANVDIKSVSHKTPLNAAVEAGNKEIVEILLANGAKVANESYHPLSLILAIRNNDYDIVEILIKNGADVNAHQGEPLSFAILSGYLNIVELLLKYSARVNNKGNDGITPLHVAAQRGSTEIVNALISKGANVNAITTASIPPLTMAAEKGHSEIVEILLQNGARLDIDYPLHEAAVRGHANVVEVLLCYGANMYMEDYEGRTALELAVGHGKLPVVKVFMQHKNVYMEDRGNNGVTLLLIAAQEDNLELVKYLVDKGANIRATNAAGSNCLHIAAREGFQGAVEFFFAKGLDVNAPGANRQTPLHYTAVKNRVEVTKYLISKGANVNAKDLNGFTPMHMAAMFGYKEVINVLLKNGAIFNDVDFTYGRSPLEIASNRNVVCNDMYLGTPCNLNNKKDVINLLSSTEKLFDAVKCNSSSEVEKFIKAGAFIDAKHTNTEATPLHYAAWKGYEKIVSILLENKANPNSVCDKGFTALHYAAKFSHLNCVKVLMSHGAIYNPISETGKTPLKLTKDKSIIDLIKITEASFKKVENNNDQVIDDLIAVNKSDLKSIMNACNRENRSLIAAALQSNFELAENLKHVSQPDSHCKLFEAVEFMNQGDYQRSMSILKVLLEKRKQILGPDNPATWDMQAYIAKVLNQQGDYNKALDMLEGIFQKQKEALGLDNKDTLDTRSTMALVLYRLGRDNKAFKIYKEVYEKQKKVLGPNDENTVNTQFHLALVLHALGKYEEALRINQAVLERKEKTLGSRHINTIVVQNNIAMVLSSQGKYDEALKMFEEVYEIKKDIIGANHTDTLRTMNSIAGILVKQNKFQEGLLAFEELLSIQKKNLQQNHPEILNTQYNIANVLFAQAKYVHAFKVFKECYDRRKHVFGPCHPSVLDAYKKMEFIVNFKFKIEGFNPDEVLQQLQKEINVASSKGDQRTVKRLLENGTDVNDADTEGRTPLHFSVNNGHLTIVNLLLENGADVTLVTNKGNTPLHTAASKDYKEIARVLLQHIDKEKLHDFVDAKTTSGGTTSLHVAAKGGHLEVAKLLLENGATYDIQNKAGKSPVELATDLKIIKLLKLIEEVFKLVKKGRTEAIDKLKNMEPDEFAVMTHARCSQGHGLLQVAIVNKHQNVAGALLAMLKELD